MHRIIDETPVDLVLLDVVLPGEDGLALARSLGSRSPKIGIIMLTGRGDTIDWIVGLEPGADDYLVMTISSRELLARLKSRSPSCPGNEGDADKTTGKRILLAGASIWTPGIDVAGG
jgi:two-component system, OmpR family, response regulator